MRALSLFTAIIVLSFFNYNIAHCYHGKNYLPSVINNKDTVNKEIIDWVENYFLKSNSFANIKDGKGNPITKSNIKKGYSISFIEKQNF